MKKEDFLKGVFPQSRELKKIIERHDWTLYDVTRPEEVVFEWEELDGEGPAEQFELDHNYIFVPVLKDGQTVREAYSVTRGLGPSLLVEDSKDERWEGYRIDKASVEQGIPIPFTRLWFYERRVLAFTPRTDFNPDPDEIGMKYRHLIDTFEKYFRIIEPEDYARTHSVMMSNDPTLN